MHRPAIAELTLLLVLWQGVAEACRKSANCNLTINGADPSFAAEQYDSETNFDFRTTIPATGLIDRSHSAILQLPHLNISLHCQPLEGGPIPVIVDSKVISKQMQGYQSFKGVQVDMINGNLDGNPHAAGDVGESSRTAACGGGHNNSQAAAVALLSFCGNFTVTFTNLTIQDVQLMNLGIQPRIGPIPPNFSTVLLFGGSRQSPSSSPTVYIHTAKVVHNAAHNAALLMTGSSRVTINKLVCRGNFGKFGACLAATDSAAVQLNNGSVSSCTAVQGAGVFTSGNASVTITGSKISHCTSSDSGGALYARDHAALTVHGSSLFNNHAANKGGALAAYGDVSVKVYSSKFSNNNASWSGGAIDADSIADHHDSPVLEISNSSFSHNRVANQDNTTGWGGALAASGSTKVNISGASSFISNVAAKRGGAIIADDDVVVKVHNSTFLLNNATSVTPGEGGGALAAYCRVTASIEHCLFQHNSAAWSGGALNIQYSTSLTVADSTFSNNRAANQDNTKGWGGALAVYGNTVNMSQPNVKVSMSQFDSNNAAWSGGAVDATNHVKLQLMDCSFVNNGAVNWDIELGWGGALAAFKYVDASIVSAYFQGNFASQGGGAISAELEVSLIIKHSSFIDNRAAGTKICSDTSKGWGGAVVVLNNSKLNVDSSLFQQNNATVAGGAVAVNDHISGFRGSLQSGEPPQIGDDKPMASCTVRLDNCKILSNSAQEKGGAFSVLSSSLTVVNGTMLENTCNGRASQGGLLSVAGNSSNPFSVVFNKGTICGSKADIGGAVWASCVDHTPGQPTPQQVTSCGEVAAADSTMADGNSRPPGDVTPCHLQLSNVKISDSSAFNGQDMWLENALLRVDLLGSNVLLDNNTVLRARGLCVMGDNCPTADNTCQMCPRNVYSIDQLVGLHPYHVCWENTQECNNVNNTDSDTRWQSYSKKLCETGYRGLLCGACQPNYGQTDPFTCSACLVDNTETINKKGIYCLMVVYTVVFVVMVWAITALTMLDPLQNGTGSHQQQQQQQQDPGIDSGHNLENAELELTDVLKALIMYSQIHPEWELDRTGSKAMINLLFPVLVFLLVLAGMVAWITQYQQRWVAVMLLVTVFFFYPSIARIAVGMLECIKVCNGQYWLMDVDKRCPTEIWKSTKPSEWPSHAIWAAAVGIPAAIIVAAVPLAVVILLVWAYHSERLHNPGNRGCFGFMYSDYNIKQVESSSSLNAVVADSKDVGHLYQYWPLRKALLQHVTLVWDAVIHVQTIILVYVSVCGMLLHEYYQTLALAAVFGKRRVVCSMQLAEHHIDIPADKGA
eukprot:gene6417-6648_t